MEKQQRLWDAARKYKENMADSPIEAYLVDRGFTLETVDKYCLGAVVDPPLEHSQFDGFLAIPYLRRTPSGTCLIPSLRFRCVQDHQHVGHGKYMTMPGDKPRLYNTNALTRPGRVVAITEGELDALAVEEAGVPAVGVPGAEAWQDHWAIPFTGYREVVLLADGDDAGNRWARKLSKSIPNSRILPSPPGEDVNDMLLELGPEGLRERITG